jgi:hypothetical protein
MSPAHHGFTHAKVLWSMGFAHNDVNDDNDTRIYQILYMYSGRHCRNAQGEFRSSELAPNNKDDEQDKDSDNGDGDDAIRGHAAAR